MCENWQRHLVIGIHLTLTIGMLRQTPTAGRSGRWGPCRRWGSGIGGRFGGPAPSTFNLKGFGFVSFPRRGRRNVVVLHAYKNVVILASFSNKGLSRRHFGLLGNKKSLYVHCYAREAIFHKRRRMRIVRLLLLVTYAADFSLYKQSFNRNITSIVHPFWDIFVKKNFPTLHNFTSSFQAKSSCEFLL